MFSWFKRTPPQTPTPASKGEPGAGDSWLEDRENEIRQFWAANPIEPRERLAFLLTKLNAAVAAHDDGLVDLALDVALQSDESERVMYLGEMLLVKEHFRHQELVRELQFMAAPSAVPYLIKAISTNLNHMVEYNGSGSGVVAKWFSHAFFDIGTPEAIEVLKRLSNHEDPEVRDEMVYRLSKLED